MFWRIFVTIWIVKIAKRQNRNTTGWGVFAFLIPNLALIIIGLLRKLIKPSIISQKSDGDQVFDQKENAPGYKSKEQIEKELVDLKDVKGADVRQIKIGCFFVNEDDFQFYKIVFGFLIIVFGFILLYYISR